MISTHNNRATQRMMNTLLVLVFLLPQLSPGFQDFRLSKGQTVYVSVYSNILTAPKGIPFYLETTLIIRNTDMMNSLTVESADFFDTHGNLLKKHVERPIVLKPLETKYFFIPETGGGVGANFIVRWNASKEMNAPIVECLMIGTKSGQGISFISSGQVIKEDTR